MKLRVSRKIVIAIVWCFVSSPLLVPRAAADPAVPGSTGCGPDRLPGVATGVTSAVRPDELPSSTGCGPDRMSGVATGVTSAVRPNELPSSTGCGPDRLQGVANGVGIMAPDSKKASAGCGPDRLPGVALAHIGTRSPEDIMVTSGCPPIQTPGVAVAAFNEALACNQPPSPGKATVTDSHGTASISEDNLPVLSPRDANISGEDKRDGVKVLLAQGFKLDAPEFQEAAVYKYFAPVYVDADLGIGELSFNQIKGILEGDITNWSECGGPDRSIVRHFHGAEKQAQTADALLASSGIDVTKMRQVHHELSPSYRSLEREAAREPGAFVLGLKDSDNEELALITIDGKNILKAEDRKSYPLTDTVTIYYTPGEERLLSRVQKRMESGSFEP
jgi:hypothetical protein